MLRMQLGWKSWWVTTPPEMSPFSDAVLRAQSLVGDFFHLFFLVKIKQIELFLRKASLKIFQIFFFTFFGDIVQMSKFRPLQKKIQEKPKPNPTAEEKDPWIHFPLNPLNHQVFSGSGWSLVPSSPPKQHLPRSGCWKSQARKADVPKSSGKMCSWQRRVSKSSQKE